MPYDATTINRPGADSMTLAEFLLERIAEDEAVAREAEAADIHTVEHEHMERWDPARVLAECGTKRRIVALHEVWIDEHRELRCDICGENGRFTTDRSAACETVALLALPYADHPDYREDWRP